MEELVLLRDELSIYNNTINDTQSLFNNKGIILTKIKYVISIKDKIAPLLSYIGLIDYHINNCSLYKKEFSLCNYIISSPVPMIAFKSIWHPSFTREAYVKNDSVINHNYLITGPNASGKSTYIKSVGILVILSQTIGLCNADTLELTPFKLINTYINIPDCKGKESLFQAEMNRCIYYLENVKLLAENKRQFAFNIMDEVFSGTNPDEGVSGAYSYLYELSKYPKSINLITTHYDYLSKLEKETNNFKNYHFNIRVDNHNKQNKQNKQNNQNKQNKPDKQSIKFTYKIKYGKSTTKIALELLNQSCFNKDMMNKSLDIYNELLKLN
jgi:DNA mismatch repair protein MutS